MYLERRAEEHRSGYTRTAVSHEVFSSRAAPRGLKVCQP